MGCIELNIEGHVATLVINRPEVRNAFDPATIFELSEAFDTLETRDDIWIVVLTGAGDQAFCAGRDLKRLAVTSRDEAERRRDEDLLSHSTRFTDRFHFCKPVIAALNGSAYGGGFELALACDIVVAADHARLALPEPRRGLIALGGGVHRLARQIPLKRAMGYLLTGREMTATEAMHLGLVNEVVPSAGLADATQRWVDDILACAPLAIRATKECVMRGLDFPLPDAMSREYVWERRRLYSRDAVEGPRAFAEKRPPVWTGD